MNLERGPPTHTQTVSHNEACSESGGGEKMLLELRITGLKDTWGLEGVLARTGSRAGEGTHLEDVRLARNKHTIEDFGLFLGSIPWLPSVSLAVNGRKLWDVVGGAAIIFQGGIICCGLRLAHVCSDLCSSGRRAFDPDLGLIVYDFELQG